MRVASSDPDRRRRAGLEAQAAAGPIEPWAGCPDSRCPRGPCPGGRAVVQLDPVSFLIHVLFEIINVLLRLVSRLPFLNYLARNGVGTLLTFFHLFASP